MLEVLPTDRLFILTGAGVSAESGLRFEYFSANSELVDDENTQFSSDIGWKVVGKCMSLGLLAQLPSALCGSCHIGIPQSGNNRVRKALCLYSPYPKSKRRASAFSVPECGHEIALLAHTLDGIRASKLLGDWSKMGIPKASDHMPHQRSPSAYFLRTKAMRTITAH
jgi:hypothetical protein